MLDDFFEPRDHEEREIAAIESLSVSIQLAIQKAMMDQGVSQKMLAERLGISPARASQILRSGGPNLTIKTLGRIAAALGEQFDFVRCRETVEPSAEPLVVEPIAKVDSKLMGRLVEEAVKGGLAPRRYHWHQSTANENDTPAKYVEAA